MRRSTARRRWRARQRKLLRGRSHWTHHRQRAKRQRGHFNRRDVFTFARPDGTVVAVAINRRGCTTTRLSPESRAALSALAFAAVEQHRLRTAPGRVVSSDEPPHATTSPPGDREQ